MKRLLEKLGIKNRQDFMTFALQFMKFGLVGLINTAVQLLVYYLLLYLGANHYFANFIGFLCSVGNSYLWNSLWVFSKEKTEAKKKSIVKFFSIYLFTFLLSNIFLFLFVDYWGVSDKIAPLLIVCINTPINFLLSKLWAFRNNTKEGG